MPEITTLRWRIAPKGTVPDGERLGPSNSVLILADSKEEAIREYNRVGNAGAAKAAFELRIDSSRVQ